MIGLWWWACGPMDAIVPPPAPGPIAVGEQRDIVLHTFRLDVEGFRIALDGDDLAALPRAATDEIVLAALPLEPLVTASLAQLAARPPEAADTLDPAAANLRQLLRASPDDLSLQGTRFASLEALSGSVGLPLARPLATLFQVDVAEPLLPADLIAAAVTEGLVASHPSSPGGLLPVTLGDLLAGFPDLAETFGPLRDHPGFVAAADGVRALGPDFEVAIRVDANALPFGAVDLSNVSDARVNSLGSQVDELFDPTEPDWLTISGILDEPVVTSLTLQIGEDPVFHGPSEDLSDPRGSTAWDLAPWTLERILADAGLRATERLNPVSETYRLATGTPIFSVDLDSTGVVRFTTFADVGDPPPAGFLGDVVSEIAQTRLHDGNLAEGDATVAFTLDDVPLGLSGEQLTTAVATNLSANPAALGPLAVAVVDNSVGAADVFYRPVIGDDGSAVDWLWFVTPEDLPTVEGARPYAYETPGFFADPALTERVSSTVEVLGDTTHEKVAVSRGDVLFAADDEGQVYAIGVGAKPSRSRLALSVERVR